MHISKNRNAASRALVVMVLVATSVLAAGMQPGAAAAVTSGGGLTVAGRHLPEGTAVREDWSFSIYQVVGGAKLPLVSADEFSAMGYTLERVTVVPVGALAAVPNAPRGGTLVRERTSFAVYLMDDGHRHWISSPPVFAAAGYTWEQVRVVANGALAAIPRGADVGIADLAGDPHVVDPGTATAAASNWQWQDTDIVHLDSADGKARGTGQVRWYNGKGLKFWWHRGDYYYGTRVRAVSPVGCIWARVKWGFPAGSVSFPTPSVSISGADERDGFFVNCRKGDHRHPSAIDLAGLGFAKFQLASTTLTVCTSAAKSDGPRWCANQKIGYR
jgi:hypothetical protein